MGLIIIVKGPENHIRIKTIPTKMYKHLSWTHGDITGGGECYLPSMYIYLHVHSPFGEAVRVHPAEAGF